MLTNIISTLLEHHVEQLRACAGEFSHLTREDLPNLALKFRFALINYEKEEGYRNLEILVWVPSNYIGVFSKETWDLWSPKNINGKSDLRIWSYHDSCWRDGLRRIIFENRERLNCLSAMGPNSVYQLVNLSEDDVRKFKELKKCR